MNYIQKFFGHLHTINTHRRLVKRYCFKCGLIKQGLLHDLSKYSYKEFFSSVKYFQGNRSPITKEKEVLGYSECWLHHKGRNKHHWEYWTDRIGNELVSIDMPFNYLLESVLDKLAASKVYKKQDFTIDYPLNFFLNSYERNAMSKHNAEYIEKLLKYYADNGEEKAFDYYRELVKRFKKRKEILI